MKKSVVSWIGLILIGLSLWVSFVGLWTLLWRYWDYRVGVFTNLVVGAMIFTIIGLRMMKEGSIEDNTSGGEDSAHDIAHD